MKYTAEKCPCGEKVCRSGNVRPITFGQGVMDMEEAVKIADLLNRFGDDPRGDFEKLTQQLEDHHNCLEEYFFHRTSDWAELLETGSLTVNWEGLKFELVLNVKLLP